MNVKNMLIAATLALAVGAPVLAQETPVVDRREKRQETRSEPGQA